MSSRLPINPTDMVNPDQRQRASIADLERRLSQLELSRTGNYQFLFGKWSSPSAALTVNNWSDWPSGFSNNLRTMYSTPTGYSSTGAKYTAQVPGWYRFTYGANVQPSAVGRIILAAWIVAADGVASEATRLQEDYGSTINTPYFLSGTYTAWLEPGEVVYPRMYVSGATSFATAAASWAVGERLA